MEATCNRQNKALENNLEKYGSKCTALKRHYNLQLPTLYHIAKLKDNIEEKKFPPFAAPLLYTIAALAVYQPFKIIRL